MKVRWNHRTGYDHSSTIETMDFDVPVMSRRRFVAFLAANRPSGTFAIGVNAGAIRDGCSVYHGRRGYIAVDATDCPVAFTAHQWTISISCDGIWAGDGILTRGEEEEIDIECTAELPYDAITAAIAAGLDSVIVEGRQFTWLVGEPIQLECSNV